jgi:glutathione peroxidase-family protein
MGCGGSSAVPASYAQSLHELSAIDIDGNNVSLRDVCLGKLTMIINVASK